MPKHRVFISIDIPEELKNIIESHLASFLFKKEIWHITAVFCGYLDEKELNKLKETTEKIVQNTKKFELIPAKIILKNNRMIWLTFKTSPEFLKLTKEFTNFNQEAREQIPHVTLVRLKKEDYSNFEKILSVKPFLVELISIMESHLSPNGPKYELICRNYLK